MMMKIRRMAPLLFAALMLASCSPASSPAPAPSSPARWSAGFGSAEIDGHPPPLRRLRGARKRHRRADPGKAGSAL